MTCKTICIQLQRTNNSEDSKKSNYELHYTYSVVIDYPKQFFSANIINSIIAMPHQLNYTRL